MSACIFLFDLRTLLLYFFVKKSKITSIFNPPTLNIICFVEKNIFEVLSVYFERDTVKTDCRIQILRKMINYLIEIVGLSY